MKNRLVYFFSIFIVLIYVFAVSFLSINLVLEYKNSNVVNNKASDFIQTKIITMFEDNSNKMKQESINSLINNYDNLYLLEIKVDNSLIFSYPKNKSISTNNSKMISSYNFQTNISDTKLSINTSFYKIKLNSIYYYSKIAFILILFAIILTIIFLIIIYHNKNEKQIDIDSNLDLSNLQQESKISSDNCISTEMNTINSVENNEKPAPLTKIQSNDSENNLQNDSEIENVDETVENNDNNDNSDDTNIDIVETPSAAEKVTLPIEEVKPVEIIQSEKNEQPTNDMFSPKTGLGWESSLLLRLNSELNRAISSEFDLSLFIIRIPEINHDDSRIKIISEYLLNQFQFKDLLFEYKNDSFVAIKTNASLDESLIFAEKIHEEIINLFPEDKINCFIGISTRTIRIISGERLLHETEEALNHTSSENESYIIAFRANIEKYRQYMNS